ncbi:MAG: hypothetical protein FWG05_03395, partial [Kiritimatiellaeota bacterium]|nr:hypothetical protein [Kiritimatiellota bacterium]
EETAVEEVAAEETVAEETAAEEAPAQPAAPAAPSGQITQAVINLFNKGLAAIERGNRDVAIDIFFRCVEQCPTFSRAREVLRKTEIDRFMEKNNGNPDAPVPHLKFQFAFMVAQGKIQGAVKKDKFTDAMVECEKLFKDYPLELPLAKIFTETAIKAELPEAGFWTMERILEQHQGNAKQRTAILETLGKLYYSAKYYKKAAECLAKVHRAKPHDSAISRLLKDSEANATLDKGWRQSAEAQGADSFRKLISDKEEAERLEQQHKADKTEADLEALIRDAQAKIDAEPRNVNYYLALSSLYGNAKMYDEAIDTIDRARSMLGNDGELDRRNSTFKIAKFDAEIAVFNEAGDAESAAAKQQERDQFVFDDIAERVRRYPNDQILRYDLATQYFRYDYTDEAIEQYQIAQKSPTVRVQSLHHLALCFRKKGLLDMAISQLEQALEFLPGMNAQKMEIHYLMGEISLEENKVDEAAKYFKEVYKNDIKFKDVAKYIEQVYAAQKAAKTKM